MNDSIFFVDPFPVKMGLKLVKIGLNMTVCGNFEFYFILNLK